MFRQRPAKAIGVVVLIALGLSCLFYPIAINREGVLWGSEWMYYAGATLIGIGLLITTVWWIGSRFTTLKITSRRTMKRTGFISRHTTEVLHEDVKNLQVSQSLVQRMLGIGELAVSSSGQDDLEIEIAGIPRPGQIAEEIRNRQ